MHVRRYSLGHRLLLFCKHTSASPEKSWLLLHWGYIGVASRLCHMRLYCGYVYGFLMAATTSVASAGEAVFWPRCQPGENTRLQFLRLLHLFQPLSSILAYPGFSEQWEIVWTVRHQYYKQDQQYNNPTRKWSMLHFPKYVFLALSFMGDCSD